MQEELTADDVRSMLDYNRATGRFVWKVKPCKRIAVGAEAGHVQKDTGYAVIRVRGRLYKAHRLAWLFVTGSWPACVIDHINGNASDNRLGNLRDTTRSGNSQNQRSAHRGSSGVMGVSREGSRFAARIRCNGRMIRLGRFETADQAHSAYVAAKRHLHPTSTL